MITISSRASFIKSETGRMRYSVRQGTRCPNISRKRFVLSNIFFTFQLSDCINGLKAFVFYREFVLGNNDIGQLMPDGTIVNGDDAADLLQGDILPGQSDLTVGSGTATSTIVYPSATIAAWESFFASVVSPSSTHTSNGAPSLMANGMTIGVGLALVQLALLYS